MLSDFTMITHHFNEDIKIIPISDVHLGAKEHMTAAWQKFCETVVNEPNTYVVLVGDLLNNGVKDSVTNVYKEVYMPSEAKRIMISMLKPLAKAGKILAVTGGNHERRNAAYDNDITYDICTCLDIEHLYRENACFVKLQFGNPNGCGTKNPTYTLCVTHGCGGGAMYGGTINRKTNFAYTIDGLDALITGHDHKPFDVFPAKIKVDTHNNRITTKPFIVVSASAWLDYGDYALRGMLRPAATIGQTMILHRNKKQIDTINSLQF